MLGAVLGSKSLLLLACSHLRSGSSFVSCLSRARVRACVVVRVRACTREVCARAVRVLTPFVRAVVFVFMFVFMCS